MKFYFTLRRSTLFALFLTVICIVFISSELTSSTAYLQEGNTNFERINFLKSINCDVEEECVSKKEITIPLDFSEVYVRYNELQKKAGFDLLSFKGAKAVVYTYKIVAYNDVKNAYANLIVCNGKIIGGDISATNLNGEMLPLLRN